jgi:hypothetical protein
MSYWSRLLELEKGIKKHKDQIICECDLIDLSTDVRAVRCRKDLGIAHVDYTYKSFDGQKTECWCPFSYWFDHNNKFSDWDMFNFVEQTYNYKISTIRHSFCENGYGLSCWLTGVDYSRKKIRCGLTKGYDWTGKFIQKTQIDIPCSTQNTALECVNMITRAGL